MCHPTEARTVNPSTTRRFRSPMTTPRRRARPLMDDRLSKEYFDRLLRERFLVQAKTSFEQMFGNDGKNGLVTFT